MAARAAAASSAANCWPVEMAMSNPSLSVLGGPSARSFASALLPAAAARWRKAPIRFSCPADGLFRLAVGLFLLPCRWLRTQIASPRWSTSALLNRAPLGAAVVPLLAPQPARPTIIAAQRHRARARAWRDIPRRNETRAAASLSLRCRGRARNPRRSRRPTGAARPKLRRRRLAPAEDHHARAPTDGRAGERAPHRDVPAGACHRHERRAADRRPGGRDLLSRRLPLRLVAGLGALPAHPGPTARQRHPPARGGASGDRPRPRRPC